MSTESTDSSESCHQYHSSHRVNSPSEITDACGQALVSKFPQHTEDTRPVRVLFSVLLVITTCQRRDILNRNTTSLITINRSGMPAMQAKDQCEMWL